jgi:hypothetical protein
MNTSTVYISDFAHYEQILSKAVSVKKRLWIGTADIKDVYMKKGTGSEPFLGLLSDLIRRKVEVRLIHAKEPGINNT